MLNKLKHIAEYKNRVDIILDYLRERQKRVLQKKLYEFDKEMLIVFHDHYIVPTFSIFYGAENEIITYNYKNVSFFIDVTIENKKEVIDFLLKELNNEQCK